MSTAVLAANPKKTAIARSTKPSAARVEPPSPPETGNGILPWLAWGLLITLLGINLPLFLCRGLDCDASFYDLCARNLLNGGVHYRDQFDTNLPGMPWVHCAIRYLFGWHSEVLRGVDFLIVAAITWLLVRWLPTSCSTSARVLLAGVLLGIYLTLSEWCHCQRDTWMLLPCLLALNFRWRQVERLTAVQPHIGAIAGSSIVEGLLWAAGFWIKPFVAFPALACWLLGALQARRAPHRPGWRLLTFDAAAVLLGGAACGAAGVYWLWATGAWPYFVDIMFVWNREYATRNLFDDFDPAYLWLGLCLRYYPWVFVYLLAVPVAVYSLSLGRPRAENAGGKEAQGKVSLTLLAGFYLAWVFQAFIVQHPHDYVHTPAILLGPTFLACQLATSGFLALRTLMASILLLGMLMRVLPTSVEQGVVWDRCFTEGSTAALRDRLCQLRREEWTLMQDIEQYLVERGAQDGEVTCFAPTISSMYLDLGFHTTTRYINLESCLVQFPPHRQPIYDELARSRQRFLVCDLVYCRHALKPYYKGERASAPGTGFNLADRIVRRFGPAEEPRYAVVELSGLEAAHWLELNLE